MDYRQQCILQSGIHIKNAMRLARTEINMAYRTADYERWKNMDFVLGIEIQLSGAHPEYDICDILQGKYPKSFKFTGWHPHCLCFAIPILMTEEQFFNDEKAEEIKDLPQNFKDWLEFHKDEINKAKEKGKLPYFLRDNAEIINYSNNLKEYEKLLKDNNYYDVQIDRTTGGLKAIHKRHNLHSNNISRETEIQNILFKNGYNIILEDETSIIDGITILDGILDNKGVEFATKYNGTQKSFKDGLNHCAKKKVSIALVYFPNGISSKDIYLGIKSYNGLKDKRGYHQFEKNFIIDKTKIIIR